MYLAMHLPMFGTAKIDSRPIECPKCPKGKERGVSNWVEVPIDDCFPGQQFTCAECGTVVTVNWGLEEPDHLSTWLSSEHCPHRLCKIKYAELRVEMGWDKLTPVNFKSANPTIPAATTPDV